MRELLRLAKQLSCPVVIEQHKLKVHGANLFIAIATTLHKPLTLLLAQNYATKTHSLIPSRPFNATFDPRNSKCFVGCPAALIVQMRRAQAAKDE
jgi:hypothetical protein